MVVVVVVGREAGMRTERTKINPGLCVKLKVKGDLLLCLWIFTRSKSLFLCFFYYFKNRLYLLNCEIIHKTVYVFFFPPCGTHAQFIHNSLARRIGVSLAPHWWPKGEISDLLK